MSLQVARQFLALESIRKWSEGQVSAGPVCRGWRSCSSCCIAPHPSAPGIPMTGQLQRLGLVRVKPQFRAHSLRFTSCAGTSWKWDCHGCGRDCLQDLASCSLQTREGGCSCAGRDKDCCRRVCAVRENQLLQDVQTLLVITPSTCIRGTVQVQMCRRSLWSLAWVPCQVKECWALFKLCLLLPSNTGSACG